MDLAKLEMFARVVECGSLSGASLHYDIGPSALSRHLAALESDFGGRLLHRTGRGVKLTELGERILPKARALLADAAALQSEIAAAASVCRGTVHVASVPAIAAPVMTRVVLLARERFPDVLVHVAAGLSGQVDQWIADGTVDLGFLLRTKPDETAGRPLAISRMCLVGSADAPLTRRAEVDFRMVDGVPLIQPGAPNAFRLSIAEKAREVGARLNVVAEVDSLELTKSMVAAGVGYALLPASSVGPELTDGRLTAARVVNPEVLGYIHLVASPKKTSSLAVRELSLLIRQVAEELSLAGRWGETRIAA